MTLHASSQEQLRQFIEQVERLEEEKKAIAADIADKFAEAKALGFDPKIMKKVIALRKMSASEREEFEAVLTTYLHAVEAKRSGGDTPMGERWTGEAEVRA